MEYRKLGNSELELSAIAYGAFAIGGTLWGGNEQKDSLESVRASIDHGVTTLDTAPFYGFGLSEEMIGQAIKGYDRSKIQLLSKFGLVWDGSNQGKGEHFFDVNEGNKVIPIYKYAAKANVIKEVEESLKRMQTDYIDLLQLHWPDQTTPIHETMEALDLLIQQGKIRAAAVSNYSVDQVKEARSTLQIASNQMGYSMLNRSIEKELVPYALENQLGIIVYSPMERGLLTGKYFTENTLKEDDHRNGYFQQFNLKQIALFLEKLKPLAQSKGVSLGQLVLRWTSLQPGITTVLAGARNAEQARANAQAIHLNLTPEEINFIQTELAKI